VRRLWLGLLLSTLLLGGCSHMGSGQERVYREAIVETALGQIGRPYQYGGDNPDGFDCSGLAQYSYLEAGVKIPRNTSAQLSAGSHIDLDEARPGDLLFYRFDSSPNSLHVAIYVGHGKMVHAPASGRQVQVIHTDDAPWPQRFVTAVRLLR
jgi:cell wall-associated NlpC family hydrolase